MCVFSSHVSVYGDRGQPSLPPPPHLHTLTPGTPGDPPSPAPSPDRPPGSEPLDYPLHSICRYTYPRPQWNLQLIIEGLFPYSECPVEIQNIVQLTQYTYTASYCMFYVSSGIFHARVHRSEVVHVYMSEVSTVL